MADEQKQFSIQRVDTERVWRTVLEEHFEAMYEALKALPKFETPHYDMGLSRTCDYCGSSYPQDAETHGEDCVWAKAQALIAEIDSSDVV